MNDNVENLVLEHLRAIRAGMGSMEAQLVEVNARLISVEKAVLKSRCDNLAQNVCNGVANPVAPVS